MEKLKPSTARTPGVNGWPKVEDRKVCTIVADPEHGLCLMFSHTVGRQWLVVASFVVPLTSKLGRPILLYLGMN